MAQIQTEAELADLAQQLQMQPFIPSGSFFVPDGKITGLLDAYIAWNYDMAIIGSAGHTVTIAIDDPRNPNMESATRLIGEQGFGVVFYLTTAAHLDNLLKTVHPIPK